MHDPISTNLAQEFKDHLFILFASARITYFKRCTCGFLDTLIQLLEKIKENLKNYKHYRDLKYQRISQRIRKVQKVEKFDLCSIRNDIKDMILVRL